MPAPFLLYLFNEASSGTTPTQVNDTGSGTAIPAPITYGASGAWTSNNGDGLHCNATGFAKTATLAGTKAQTNISGATAGTIELVIDATGNASAETFFSLDNVSTGAPVFAFTISPTLSGGEFELANDAGLITGIPVPGSGVFVLHIVPDTSQATNTNRMLFYVNGSPVTPTGSLTWPAQNTALDAGCGSWSNIQLGLGLDVQGGAQIPLGSVFYAAVYAVALTPTQIAANATALLANNDVNPNGPAINTQPASVGVYNGQSANFSISASAIVGGTLSYQWTFNGSNVGSNQNTYSRATTLADNGGIVACTVSETGGGSTTSANALLNVWVAPPSAVSGGGALVGGGPSSSRRWIG